MKRFIAFVWPEYEEWTRGGWGAVLLDGNDAVQSFDTIEEARDEVERAIAENPVWREDSMEAHIVDLSQAAIVLERVVEPTKVLPRTYKLGSWQTPK